MDNRQYALHIGRMPGDDTWWLCIADLDGTDISLVAKFQSKEHADFFTQFMKTQGYSSLSLPTQREIDGLFDE